MLTKSAGNEGAVLVLVAICMSLFFILLAIAVDIGFMHATKAELQHAADSAALAGASDLAEATPNPVGRAQEYAAYNQAAKVALTNLPNEDVTVGWMEHPFDIHEEIQTGTGHEPNSVEVTTRRAAGINGPLQLFLGAFTGLDEVNISTKGRAVWTRQISGFAPDAPSGGSGGLPNIIPFSVSTEEWDKINGPIDNTYVFDQYTFDLNHTPPVFSGPDGFHEIKMYPRDKKDSVPGNYGTVDIGNTNNAVPDIRRQILFGISAEDLAYLGGSFDLTDNTELDGFTPCECYWLEADTGISAGFKDQLEAILGIPKTILVHNQLIGQGNNAKYRIVRFEKIVIVEVKMTGNPKYVRIQKVDKANADGGQGEGTPIFNPDVPPSDTLYMTGLTR